jgi:acetyl/propionyl-CoA carboxylase alpha subunit
MAKLVSGRELQWRIGEQDVSCRVERSQHHGTFHASGITLPFRFLDAEHIEISGERHRFYVIHNRDSSTVWLDGRTYYLKRAVTNRTQATGRPSTGEIHALMPGKLVSLSVAVGDTVIAKQTVGIMESMKMETSLTAPIPGRVAEVHFKPGDVVDMGQVVMVIQARPGEIEQSGV